jgi:diacylglycerol kinase (ATP)
MKICPEAEPDDGIFDVLLIGDLTKRDLLLTLPKTYRGSTSRTRRPNCSAAPPSRSSRPSRYRSSSTASSQGTTPVEFELVPQALRLRVPS